MLSRHRARVCAGLLLVGLLALSSGCSDKYKSRAVVKGRVSFGGKFLTVGNVMFLRDDGVTASTAIDKNGNYVMNDAPVGNCRVTVSVPKLPPGGLGRSGPAAFSGARKMKDQGSVNPENPDQKISIMGEMPANVVPIPDKYANEETSGLTFTVEKGEQTHDIVLKP